MKRTIAELRSTPPALDVAPARDVTAGDGRLCATSSEPWVKLRAIDDAWRGRIVEIVYSAPLHAPSRRPTVRFRGGGAHWDFPMPAPSEGRGRWRGRVPRETVEIWFNPVDCEGPFIFRVEALRTLPSSARLKRALAAPKRSFFAASARLVGLRNESDLNLRWALSRAETQNHATWKSARALKDTTAPAPPIDVHILLHAAGATAEHAMTTVRSLQSQSIGSWRVTPVGAPGPVRKILAGCNDPRVGARAQTPSPAAWVCFLRAGDQLAPHALACFAAHLARRPAHEIVYADEAPRADGAAPVFKPDWSPTLQAFAPYVGRAAFVSGEICARRGLLGDPGPEAAVDRALADATPGAIGHIARALFHTPGEHAAPPRARASPAPLRRAPSVGVVIPTRDRLDLLAPCLDSLFGITRYANFRVLVVDNGSVETRTRRALADLSRAERRLRVKRSPGPFNFSLLCNLGADRLDCEFLIFLNNDTVILQADWIDNLLRFAAAPDIGAVGAKLLLADRRVQHAGVVLGLGGVAGHFGAGLARSAPGWLGANMAPHEASAVTGACLMVEKRKFDAVGGFDDVNLPVELNDVDLCLRLAERGWRTVCDCRTELLHRESASRGGGLRLQSVYARERDYFVEKWRRTIRNDPFFNPNLSLYDYAPRLA